MRNWLFLLILLTSLFFFMGCWWMADDPSHVFDYDRYIIRQNELIKESRERRLQYLQSHKGLTARQEGLIEAGIIGTGLTKEHVILIEGRNPDEIKRTTEYGADEVWVYKWRSAKQYLYFKDDILIKIERTIQTIFGEKKTK